MKILITGGAGFIGSHLCERLLQEQHTVICVDNLCTGNETNVLHLKNNPSFRFIKHDVILPLEIETKIDAIYHLASPASPNHYSPISYHALPMETMLVNTRGTLNMLKLAEKNQAHFLFASTSEVYGDPLEHPQREEYNGNVSTTGPRSVYDEAKRFGETLTAYFQRDKKVDTRIARIFNTYGPRMVKSDMRMIVIFIVQALEGKPITVFGDGSQTRSLCFVDDTVTGLMKLLFTPGLAGEIVNIGSTEEHSVMEYAQMIKEITQSKSDIICSEALPENDPKKRRPDISKAKKLIDWQPTTSLRDGLTRIVTYLRDNTT